jgi:hypothetical protein
LARITVKLMREPGEPIKSTTDMAGFITHCAASGDGWRVLHEVDEVGDTSLDSSRMPDLLADWEEAWPLVRSFEDENCWHKVRALAVECEAGTHLYLQFVGD